MSSVIQARYAIIEQVIKISDPDLLARLADFVRREVTTGVEPPVVEKAPEAKEALPDPTDPKFRVPVYTTLEALTKAQNVKPLSKEEWENMADVYAEIPAEEIAESLK